MKEPESIGDAALRLAPLVAALGLVIYLICIILYKPDNTRVLVSNLFFAAPVAIADFMITKTYAKHNKNTMKSLIGFILAGLLMLSLHYAFSYFDPAKWYFIIKAVLFLFIAVFTVNQFLLSNDHYSRPGILFINQLIMDLLVVISIIAAIVNLAEFQDNPVIFISLLVFVICTMFIVLYIEMRVNEFKVKREEKGYVFVKSGTTEDILEKEDMFIGNGLFYSLPWFILAGLAGLIAFNAVFDTAITWGYSIRYLFYVVKIICLFAAVRSYKTHHKNVMKVMLGFLLGMLLFENMCEITFISTGAVRTLKSIATIGMVLVNAVFLILHLQLTRTHAGSRKIVNLMKIVYVIYAVLTLLTAVDCSIYYILAQGNNYIFFVFKPILWILGTFPVITGILTIDTRVNGFKLKRDKRG